MMTTPIQAVDERVLPFAPEQVWAVLADAAHYPDWYPPSVRVKVRHVSASLTGSEFEIQPRGGRAFRCRVVSTEAPLVMRMLYPGAFIVGTGEWRLAAVPGGTRVCYTLDVVATGWLAAILGQVLPFAKIHSKAMQEILAALEQETAGRRVEKRRRS